MTLRVKLDRTLCQGHGICYFVSDRLFRLSDQDGKSEVLLDPVPPDLAEAAGRAAEGCPERAIAIVDEH